jgi:hypothetical protein
MSTSISMDWEQFLRRQRLRWQNYSQFLEPRGSEEVASTWRKIPIALIIGSSHVKLVS